MNQSGHWRIYQTIASLEKDGLSSSLPAEETQELTQRVITILKQWAEQWAGKPQWQSFLNKSSLLHEVEETIIVLHSLLKWLSTLPYCTPQSANSATVSPITLVDVCSGKGVFSMISSYLFAKDARVQNIVMLDKADINWTHIAVANESHQQEHRAYITSWKRCNLHQADAVVVRLKALNTPLALVGIHLCKLLTPVCIGIANTLEPSLCPFFCLAPCCLPRVVTTKNKRRRANQIIQILQYETTEERIHRLAAKERRKDALKRRPALACYLCRSIDHPIHKCSLLPKDEAEKLTIFSKAALLVPCWKCGVVGHFKATCTSEQIASKPSLVTRPVMCMEVAALLKAQQPFDKYCELLATTIQRKHVELIETGLVNESAQHQEKNWNGMRKSIYIVATQTLHVCIVKSDIVSK